MAFNPFNIFRRNQRAIFAVITVFIMFTFVLSSGLGGGADFFDWFPRWLSGKKKGEPVCTIDGAKVYPRDLEAVRRDRVLANKFMTYASEVAEGGLRRYAQENKSRLGSEARAAVDGAFRAEETLYTLGQNPQFRQFLPQLAQGFQQAVGQLRAVLASPTAGEEDKDVVRRALTAFTLAQQRQSRGGDYFGVVPNRTSRDAVEFLLWDKKAKDLGISFNDADVGALVQAEFQQQLTSDVEIRQALLRENPAFTLEAVRKALATEFRVRTAQAAVLGPVSERADRTLSALPVFAPPYEVYDFYRDKMSPTTYEVLAVPAANFTELVKGEPTEDEVRRLYEEHKDREPDPAREEPGFRDPKKVKVEWVAASGDEPYYVAKAKEAIDLAERYAASEAWAFTVPVPGIGGGWAAAAVAPLAVKDPLVGKEYETAVVGPHRNRVRFQWGGSPTFLFSSDLLDTSVVTPQVLAAAVGGLGRPITTANLAAGMALAAEQKARVRTGMPLVLAGIPGPGLPAQMVGAEALSRAAVPQPLPLAAARPELLGQLVEKKARDLAVKDLEKLRDDIGKLTEGGKKPNKDGVTAAVAEFVKVRGLKTGRSADFQSEFTIGDDPGLAPLKAVVDKPAGGLNPHGNAPIAFGRRFFYADNPFGGPAAPAAGTYKPELYPERPTGGAKGDPAFLSWRTDEQAAKGVAYLAAKPRVVEAWKRLKARELAKNEAERIAADLRAFPGDTPTQFLPRLRDIQAELQAKSADPKAKDRVKLFQLDKVAPLQEAQDVMMMTGGQLRGYEFNATADIPYPTREMGKAILDGRTAGPKTVTVLPDKPKDTFYVAVVGDRRERSPEEFRAAMLLGGRGTLKDGVMAEFYGENARKARTAVLALLKKEYGYTESEEQKKRLDESKSDE